MSYAHIGNGHQGRKKNLGGDATNTINNKNTFLLVFFLTLAYCHHFVVQECVCDRDPCARYIEIDEILCTDQREIHNIFLLSAWCRWTATISVWSTHMNMHRFFNHMQIQRALLYQIRVGSGRRIVCKSLYSVCPSEIAWQDLINIFRDSIVY